MHALPRLHTACLFQPNAGIIRAVSVACTNAHSLLTQQGSAAAMHSSFSQFLVAVLALWNDLIHLLPNNTQKLSGAEDDPLAPLLLPGAALSSAALKTYLGPDAAAIAASDGRVAAGYTFVPVLGDTAAAGLAAAVQVQCLCVGEQIVKCCYYYYMLDMQGTSVIQAQGARSPWHDDCVQLSTSESMWYTGVVDVVTRQPLSQRLRQSQG